MSKSRNIALRLTLTPLREKWMDEEEKSWCVVPISLFLGFIFFNILFSHHLKIFPIGSGKIFFPDVYLGKRKEFTPAYPYSILLFLAYKSTQAFNPQDCTVHNRFHLRIAQYLNFYTNAARLVFFHCIFILHTIKYLFYHMIQV